MIGPAEGFGHRAVVVSDKGIDLGREIVDREEGAPPEELTGEDTEPDLNLIHPGGVRRGVMEDGLMRGVAQESRTTAHRLQHAAFAFDAKMLGDPFVLGNEADKRLRLMHIEVVEHQVPLGRMRVNERYEQRHPLRSVLAYGMG